MAEDILTAREELRERIREALKSHAQTLPMGFREGDVEHDAECPWHYGEMPWVDFADAVLDALGLGDPTRVAPAVLDAVAEAALSGSQEQDR